MSKIVNITKESDLNNILQDKVIDNAIADVVTKIIGEVKDQGDQALFNYTKKFDNLILNKKNIIFTKEEINTAYNNTAKDLREVIKLSYERIYQFHSRQYPKDHISKDKEGLVTGWKWYPIDSVGIYVPGGSASYPSSVIMSGAIAKAAGTKEIIMTMPCPDGDYNPAALAAAKIVGIDQIYKVGGSQAIAALAYGSSSVPKVSKIVGPGNVYVAEAKRQLFGTVGIDSVAGPSEILIIADDSANAEWIACDLLSQAEHDYNASSVLITDSRVLADDVQGQIDKILPTLKRKDIASGSWHSNGKIFVVDSLPEMAVILANKISPEHLELMVGDPEYYLNSINSAGAIFIGSYSTEAIGDYMAGPSHVLPTCGTAKFSSGLSVYDFLRKSSIINCSKDAFDKIADDTILFAESEGLECHARAIKVRQ